MILTELAFCAVEADRTAASVGVAYRDTATTVQTRSSIARMLSTVVDVHSALSVSHQFHHALVDRQLKNETLMCSETLGLRTKPSSYQNEKALRGDANTARWL